MRTQSASAKERSDNRVDEMVEDRSSVLVIVEGEPVAKGRPRVAMRGPRPSLYTPGKTREYEDKVRAEAVNSMGSRELINRPCMLELTLVFSVPVSYTKLKRAKCLSGEIRPTTRIDFDNCAKAVCDALNGVVWTDDALVTDATIRKRFGEVGYVQAIVTPLGADPSN